MTAAMLPFWKPWRRHRADSPSPIPQAAAESRRLAAEVARLADQLRRVNDIREANPR